LSLHAPILAAWYPREAAMPPVSIPLDALIILSPWILIGVLSILKE
jgi:hypothetical protein